MKPTDKIRMKRYPNAVTRTIVPEPNRGAPQRYRCSECGWHFALNHISFVVEYLDERKAQDTIAPIFHC